MHFITWLYLIIETLHKLCTIIPRYIFIEEDFFQRKSKKWERNCSFIPIHKMEYTENRLRHWNPALWHTIHQTNLLHLKVLRSICPLSGPLTLHHQTFYLPWVPGKMNSTSSNHHLYVIKLSTLAGSGYTEWDLITVNYTYQSNLTN